MPGETMINQESSMSVSSKPKLPSAATLAGLFVALVLPSLIVLGFHRGDDSLNIPRIVIGEVAFWAIFIVLIAIVLLGEKRSLASIGVKRFKWWVLPLGILAGFITSMVFPLVMMLTNILGFGQDNSTAMKLFSLPFTIRLLLVLRAAVVEETLFRGYPIERLTTILGNQWTAALVTIIIFAAAHVPFWGVAHTIPVVVASILLTLLYLWKRNLILNVIAHFVVDGIGFLLVPLIMNLGG